MRPGRTSKGGYNLCPIEDLVTHDTRESVVGCRRICRREAKFRNTFVSQSLIGVFKFLIRFYF